MGGEEGDMVENEIARIRAEMSEEEKWITEELAIYSLILYSNKLSNFLETFHFCFPAYRRTQFSTFPLPRDNFFENSSKKKKNFFSKNSKF